MDARRIDASGSAEQISGSNLDEMDGEGAAFGKRRQLSILSPAEVKGLHEFVVVGLEREHIAQERIVLRILAIGMGIQQKSQSVVIKREELCHTRQVVRTEMSKGDSQFGYLQFFIIKRLISNHLQSHRQLIMRSANDMPLRAVIMTGSVTMPTSRFMTMWRLRHHSHGYHRRS